MEGKRNVVVILIAAVVILALALAVLSGYLLVVAGSKHNESSTNTQANVSTVSSKANADNFTSIKLFESDETLNLKYGDNEKPIYIVLNMKLEYYKSAKNAETLINNNLSEIKELVATYFQKLTLAEVKVPETKDKARKDLVKMINQLLASAGSDGRDIVHSITWEKWLYQ